MAHCSAATIFVCMRILCLLALIAVFAGSCGNEATTARPLCDTTCNKDTLRYVADHKLKPMVSVSMKNCFADTLTWTHEAMEKQRQAQLGSLLDRSVRMNAAAVDCFINDTSYAYLSFNDCATGRGYLLKLPYDKKNNIRKISSALNRFDPKFSVAPDLRAFADKSTIYVVNVKTDKEEVMTFKEVYEIDWDNIHETIDSINVTPQRIYVKLLKNGKEIPLEKKINL